ncbi:spermidine/putrescine ABC transporter permease PotB [Candidatus Profftia sp. (ex Adelges kitamiensis)]|uniref:spermidine/putrescine ABC transporter permease PotB n=1 Tax=Candidatus Profftia sp. (ex Adelges kitamiensis) TaxID=2864218 RepID=UPI001CE2AD1C|nr:spermidine/putrescine ABC transporter permease PotB [Candidatus Profftia sp. (ex Adelges kitamiensis)]
MNKMHKYFKKIVILIVFFWLVLFVLIPNLIIIVTSFMTKDDTTLVKMVLTFDSYIRLFDPLYTKVLLHTLSIAIFTTICCLLCGYPFAFILVHMPDKLRFISLFLLIAPLWTSSLVRIYGLKIFLSTKGYLNEFLLWMGIIDTPLRIIYTPEAVILGLIYILQPFMVIPLYSSIQKLDNSVIEAARDLGANKIQIFIRIIIPLTLPGIIAGSMLVMLSSLGMFYVSDLLGGAHNLLIGNVIKNQFLNIGNWPFGAATSIVLNILMGMLMYIYYRVGNLMSNKVGL